MAGCLVLLGVAGCADPRSELIELEEPSLERVEPAIQEKLTEALTAVRALARRSDVDDETLGAAYGDLGGLRFVFGYPARHA